MGKGHVLGVTKDYDSRSDAMDRIERGTRFRGSYQGLVVKTNHTFEEDFDMLSKEDVDSFIKVLFDLQAWKLSEDEFPSLMGGRLFWSAVYHYHQQLDVGARPKTLLGIYKKICEERDWDVVAGRGRGKKRN